MMTVFIADDSPLLCARLYTILSDISGIDVIGRAHTIQQTIDSVASEKPDVVLVGLHKPHGGAMETVRSLKQVSDPPVVIMLNSHSFPQYIELCQEAGADFIFDKGTQLNELTELLERLTQHSRAEGRAE